MDLIFHIKMVSWADGELFTGTTSDFWGKKAVISRHLSKDGRPDVNLDKDTSINLLDGKCSVWELSAWLGTFERQLNVNLLIV